MNKHSGKKINKKLRKSSNKVKKAGGKTKRSNSKRSRVRNQKRRYFKGGASPSKLDGSGSESEKTTAARIAQLELGYRVEVPEILFAGIGADAAKKYPPPIPDKEGSENAVQVVNYGPDNKTIWVWRRGNIVTAERKKPESSLVEHRRLKRGGSRKNKRSTQRR